MIDLAERRSMGEMLTKVGPKGYIHGWIFVGAPGVGAEVYHPQKGRGVVTAHDGTHATVKFHSGETHSFEAARKPGAEHHFEPRGGKVEAPKHRADDLAAGRAKPKDLSDDELKASDKEFERRATALGRSGQVSKTHQAVKDELKRRDAAKPKEKPSGSDHLKQSLDNKLDLSKLSDDELGVLQTAHARTGGASDVRAERDAHLAAHTRVSAERAKRAQQSQGANRAKYNKLSDAASAQGRKASAVGTPEAHDKATQMHRVAAEAAMSPAARETHERRMAAHEKEAARLRAGAGGGKGPEKPAGDYEAAKKAAPSLMSATNSQINDQKFTADAAKAHRRAARLAPDDKTKQYHLGAARQYEQYYGTAVTRDQRRAVREERAAALAGVELAKQGVERGHGTNPEAYDRLAEAHDRLGDYFEKNEPARSELVERARGRADAARENAASVRARQDEHKKKIKEQLPGARTKVAEWDAAARGSKKRADVDKAINGHREVARHARAIGANDIADEHEAAAAKLEADAKDFKKPSKPRSKVPGLTEEGAKEPKMDLGHYGKMHPADAALQHGGWGLNTEQLRSAKTELERRGVTEGGRDKISQTHKKVSAQLVQSEAHEKEWNKPGGGADFVRAQQEARQLTDEAKKTDTPEAHEAAAAAHRRAKTLAYTNDSRSVPYHNASIDYHEHAAAQRRREKAFADARTEANRASEATEPAHRFTEEGPHRAAQAAHEKAARLALNEQDRAHHERIAAQHETTADKNAADQAERDRVESEARAKRTAQQVEQQRAKGEAPADFTKANEATKKAKRTGTMADHVAAANAHAKIANDTGLKQADRGKARVAYREHAKAIESLDNVDEAKGDAEIHAEAAERTGDADAHRAAASSYREAADHMDDVPGGRKQAAALRKSAKEHEDTAADIDKRSAAYVKDFTAANRASNAANRSGVPDEHRAAAKAHREAARSSMTQAQARYHEDEAKSQDRKARLGSAAPAQESTQERAARARKESAYNKSLVKAAESSQRADASDDVDQHKNAAGAHRTAAQLSLTAEQRKHHEDEAARHSAKADELRDEHEARRAEADAKKRRAINRMIMQETPAESGSYPEARQQIARAETAADEKPSAETFRAAAEAHRTAAARSEGLTVREMYHESQAKEFDAKAAAETPKADGYQKAKQDAQDAEDALGTDVADGPAGSAVWQKASDAQARAAELATDDKAKREHADKAASYAKTAADRKKREGTTARREAGEALGNRVLKDPNSVSSLSDKDLVAAHTGIKSLAGPYRQHVHIPAYEAVKEEYGRRMEAKWGDLNDRQRASAIKNMKEMAEDTRQRAYGASIPESDPERLEAAAKAHDRVARLASVDNDKYNAMARASELRDDVKTAQKSATASKSAETDVYWTTGDGALKIAWTTAGSYDRALTYLGKYITDETELKGYCSKLYYQVLKTQPPTGDHDQI
jgi:hypothetical protein